MGLLEGIRVARSSDPAFRRAACDVDDYYVDVPYEGEVVRARLVDGRPETVQGRRPVSCTLPDARTPASRSARRATPGCAGCNR